MAVEVKLPDLGEGIESGDILNVLVQAGDMVRKGQSIIELETEKATVEVPSSQNGRVGQVLVKAGQTVKIGQALLVLESSDAPPAAKAPASSPPSATKSVATAVPSPPPKVPPAAPPAPSESKPTSKPIPHKSPPKAAPRPVVVTDMENASNAAEAPSRVAAETSAAPSKGGPVAAGPAVRRFAREVGVDLASIRGSGDGGRITRDDVLEVVRRASKSAHDADSHEAPEEDLPGVPSRDDYGTIRIESASRVRKTIASRMHESWTTVPRVTNFDDADVTELEKIRGASKDDYAANGIKLTTMPFLVKAISMALRKHPVINASYDAEGAQIIYKRYVNMGIAVDSPRGLVVPVIRNTDRLSIAEIARELAHVATRVKENHVGLDDLRGGTFTISNLGAIGGTYSTPIVNIPEVAILLAGRSRKMPAVLEDDSIAIRLMMPLSISYDHRIVDGAAAARFLNDVIAYLEAPGRLLLAP